MPQLADFTKALEKFNKAVKEHNGSEMLKGFRDSNKVLKSALTTMDNDNSNSPVTMKENYDEFVTQLGKWANILVKQAEKENKKLELTMAVRKLNAQILFNAEEYKNAMLLLQENNAPKEKPVLAEIKGKTITKNYDEQKIQAVTKKLVLKRNEELKVQMEWKTKMGKALELLNGQRAEVEKLLEATEKASTEGKKNDAKNTALNAAEIAKKAKKFADESIQALKKMQNEYMQYRNGLNWGNISKEFGLDGVPNEKELQERYDKQLNVTRPLYAQAIIAGSASLLLGRQMVQVVNEMNTIAMLCVTFATNPSKMKEVVLNDLTDSSGTTTRASFVLAISGDPQKSVEKIVNKMEMVLETLATDIKEFKGATDLKAKQKLMDDVPTRWAGLMKEHEECGIAFQQARQVYENAKRRIPKTLVDDGDIKKVLLEMGTILVKAKEPMNKVTNEIEDRKKKMIELNMLKN